MGHRTPASKPTAARSRRGTRTMILLAASLSLLFPGLSAADPPEGGNADLILTGAQIVTMDDAGKPFARAIAITDGHVSAVDTVPEVMRQRGADTSVVDLRGKTVIPGLQDSHIHLTSLGWELENVADLTFALSQEDILQTLKDHIARVEPAPGEWIEGTRWQEHKYEGGMVTRWQVDEIAPDNPVMLSAPGGAGGIAVNTRVFELMGIHDNDPDTWPDWWLEDPDNFTPFDAIRRELRTITTVDGDVLELEVPTGVFRFAHGGSPAGQLVTVSPPGPSAEEQLASIRDGAREMLSLGVTSVIIPVTRGSDQYLEAQRRGWLPIRVANMYEGGFRTQPPSVIGQTLQDREDAGQFGGDTSLKMQGVKFFADGGALTRSAWVSEPFHNWEEIEGSPNTGFAVVEDPAVREAQYRAVLDRGWTLHTHATGDRAMRQVTDLYASLLDERPDEDLRFSIEHGYLPTEPATSVIGDMADHGIVASVQPIWTYQHGAAFLANFGPERFSRTTPVASLMRAGVVVASGSDYLVNHHSPWLGIYSLLTREIQGTNIVGGSHERVGILDALRTYTINGAYLSYDDDVRGSLAVGKLADLVVLDLKNIHQLQADPALALDMESRILWTMVGGETQYVADTFGKDFQASEGRVRASGRGL